MDSPAKKITAAKLLSLTEELINKPKLNKSVVKKCEDWSARLKLMHNELEFLKAGMQAKDKNAETLDKTTAQLKKKLQTLTKELQKTQDSYAKKRGEIHSKVLSMVDSTETESQIIAAAIKENRSKIEAGLKVSKGHLDEMAKKLEDFKQIFNSLTQDLTKTLLPQKIESCAQSSSDLKERLEAIHKTTADMSRDNIVLQNPGNIKTLVQRL